MRHLGDLAGAAESVDQFACGNVHEWDIPIFGTSTQAKSSDNGNCDNRMVRLDGQVDLDDIKQRMVAKGLRQADLARALDLAPNKITKIFRGERQVKAGEMLTLQRLLAQEADADRLRVLPVIGMVAAGNWREAIQRPIDSLPISDPSLPPRAFALKVQGDSMDLLVDDGGQVIVDPDDQSLYPGRYYVVLNAEGEATFKQFRADPARLVPCSSNPAHQEMAIGGSAFDVIGRVIWRSSRM